MLDQNDLRMIGALLDEKLETKLEEKLAPMRKDIGELKEEVSTLKKETDEKFGMLSKRMDEFSEKMDAHYNSLLSVFGRGEELHTKYKDDIPQMKKDITSLKIRSELYARRFTEMAQAASSS